MELKESRNDGENDTQRTAEGTHTSPRPQGAVSSALARARQALMNEHHQSHDAARPSGRFCVDRPGNKKNKLCCVLMQP